MTFQSLKATCHPGLSTPFLMWMPGLGAPLILCVLLKVSPLPATGLSDQSFNMLAICMVLSLPEIDTAHRQLQSNITCLPHGILQVLCENFVGKQCIPSTVSSVSVKLGKACYHSVLNYLAFCLLCKIIKTKIYNKYNLPVCMGVKLGL